MTACKILVVRTLFHFSEDPAIALFRPRVAPTSNETTPLIWALDQEHAPGYWFPRDCPRACCWASELPIGGAGAALLGLGGARRLHAIEARWLERVRACRLYVYEFDAAPFRPKISEAGYWVSEREVEPLSVTLLGDLLARHAEAEIELRIVRNLLATHRCDQCIGAGVFNYPQSERSTAPGVDVKWRRGDT